MYQNYIDEAAINKSITKVVLWMVYGLFVTGVAIASVITNETMANFVFNSFHIILIAEFGLVVALSRMLNKMTYTTAKVMFTFYSFLSGLTLSIIMFYYDLGSIITALGTTIVIFVVMSIFGLTTKEDLSKFTNLFKVALISLIVVSIINFFMQSYALYWIISYAGVIIFTALIGFDMQRIKANMYEYAGGDEEVLGKISIIGALNLYLDFVNLFIYLLRILGRKK